MKRYRFLQLSSLALLLASVLLGSSCRRFVFGEIVINEEEDPRIVVKVPTTRADIYFKEPPVVTTPNLQNPDKDGAFADWATCLVMIKEGHSHGGGKLHGNYVYRKSPWRQEEFAVIKNTPNGPVVDIDNKSTVTYLEEQRGIEGPEYFRVIAGPKTLWGLTFYFYDKEGKLMNDRIYDQSENYQIFFSVSDTDSEGKPYQIMNTRWQGVDVNPTAKKFDWHLHEPDEWPEDCRYPSQDPYPSEYFKGKMDFSTLQKETKHIFRYVYRDTWQHEYMNDGVRDLFNIRLLPPLTKENLYVADDKTDVDCVGLKGHLNFDFGSDLSNGVDAQYDWPEPFLKPKLYYRPGFLLPEFYLAVRVMKKLDGNKVVRPLPEDASSARSSGMTCAHHTGPENEEGWEELMRFNIPIRVFASLYDSDPTAPDPHEPFYWQIAMEIKLTPSEVFEAARNRMIHSSDGMGGEGFGQWFL